MTNNVESFFSVFKRGMRGTYQHCAEKHLHRYLAEFDFRFNNRTALGVDDGRLKKLVAERDLEIEVMKERRAAMYLACVALNLSAKRVARALGRYPSTVTEACRCVEDMRAEPKFDRWIDALERTAQAAPAPFKARAK